MVAGGAAGGAAGAAQSDGISLEGATKKEDKPQSLLQKYWWVAIPLVVMSMSAPEEPKKGGGKGSAEAPATKA